MRRAGLRACAVLAALAGIAACRADAIDDLVRRSMDQDRTPAVALAIVQPDGSRDVRVYGTANVELGVACTPQTVFRWASLTKQFTAASILLLCQRGRLSLSDSVTQHIAEAPESWREVTVQTLLNHTSGLVDRTEIFDISREYTLTQYIALVSSKPLKWKPGARFEYSNPGYALLGLIVERVSGQPLGQFVKENLLDPAGMTTARFHDPFALVPNRAAGYRFRMGALQNDEADRPQVYAGSGGLMGSILDLAAWDAFLRRKGLPEEIAGQMKSRPRLADGSLSSYGCGWFLSDWNGSEIIRHGGTTFGFTSVMIRDATKGVSVLLLRNSSQGEAPALARSIYDAVIARGERR